jgi:drug/metabolite transporter (DMT)-like permease
MGAGWGLSLPLAKVAVSGGYQPFGLIFWQFAIGAVLLGGFLLRRGRLRTYSGRQIAFCLLIALMGTIFPNSASYRAAFHLPAGVIAIIIAMVPIFAFPVAIAFGNERFSARRALGLCVGLASVIIIMAPEASLPNAAMAAFIPLALVAPFFYGIEGNVVAKWGTHGLSPIETLFGASVIGAILILPITLVTGQFISPFGPFGTPDAAMVALAFIHAVVYCGYVWIVGRAGAVFAAQTAYLVTGFGVLWSMLLLGERYSGWIWAALALMVLGIILVQPRHEKPRLASDPATGDTVG